MRVAREGTKMLENAIEQLSQKKTTKVGWFETAKYPDGTSVAYVAQILELGYAPKNIPPFAMLRQTIDMNEEEWSKFFNGVATKIIQGRMTLNQAMEALGLLVAGDVRKTWADISKAKKMLKYNPKVKFKEGMKKTYEWFINSYVK